MSTTPGADLPDTDLESDDEVIEEAAPLGPEPAFTAIDWSAQASDADGKIGADVIQTLVKRLPNGRASTA